MIRFIGFKKQTVALAHDWYDDIGKCEHILEMLMLPRRKNVLILHV